jgi:hypothetical protein
MALISSIDGPNRRIYLGLDSTSSDFQPMDIYKEMRTLRRTDENLRKYDAFLEGAGYVAKGGGKFTPRYVICKTGTRLVPYDGNHTLTVIGEIITDEQTSGIECFDKTLLTPGVLVDIDYQPTQVEIIERGTSGLTPEESAKLTNIDTISMYQMKILDNKRILVKVGSTWYLRVFDDNGTTIIQDKALKDVAGAEITDIEAGALAQEYANSV